MSEKKTLLPWSKAVIPPEEPAVAKADAGLRSRLDDYRLELQRLQDGQEEHQTISRLIRTLARKALKEPFAKLTGSDYRKVHKDDHLLCAKDFQPYVLKLRKAPSTHPRPVVLHCIGNMTVGGLSRLVIDLVEWTSDRYEHVVFTRHNPNPPAFTGVKIVEIGGKISPVGFARSLKGFNPALIHVHHYAPHHLYEDWQWYRLAILAAGETGTPVIEGVNVPMTPYCHPAIKTYVFVSRYVVDAFGFEHCANRVIYPGSDFSLFAPRPRQFSDTVGMVYRLDESKLRKESIEVFIQVLRERPAAKALIVGDGYLLPHFKNRVQATGLAARFTFTGYSSYEKLPDLYSRMDVFVAPVFCESFGQVTLFAMNMGVPVVAYGAGALPEILADPTVIAPAGDENALTKIILDLLANPERRIRTAARQQARAAAQFSVEYMTDEYARLYENLFKPEQEKTSQTGNS